MEGIRGAEREERKQAPSGRVTYELMAAFWPTPSAATLAPVMAERMYRQPKVVFSRTLDRAAWNNTVLIKGNLVGEVRGLKGDPGPDMLSWEAGASSPSLRRRALSTNSRSW